MRGKLIVFEGIDGVGKSSQVRRLAEALHGAGRDVVELFEPTDGPHGLELRRMAREGRRDPERERELFLADRREDVERNILPALRRGAVVLLDRYYFSTMAYQGAAGLDVQAIRSENEAFAPQPDLLVVLDLPVEEALRRVTGSRGSQADAYERAGALRRVKAVFDGLDDPFVFRVDASLGEEEISAVVLRRVEGLLGEGG
jgi:dTMP kinase